MPFGLSLLTVMQHLIFGMFLGAVIGIDREKNNADFKFAGIRTFTLIGLLGVVLAFVEGMSNGLFIGLLAGFLLLIVSSYVIRSFKYNYNGGTSELASLVVLIAGYFVGNDNYTLASSIVIATAILLYGKIRIHNITRRISALEAKSIIQFLILVFIILPLLPNESFGPFDSFNPYTIWLMVVLISGISFVSYIIIKVVGHHKGISLSGFLGGMINSTAVTATLSRRSKDHTDVVIPFVLGILMASIAMLIRLFTIVNVISPALAYKTALPLLSMATTGGIISLILHRRYKNNESTESIATNEFNLGAPLDIKAALKFGIAFSGVIFISKFMIHYLGDSGVYLTSIVSALLETSAITVSYSNLVADGILDLNLATWGITIAAITNICVKGCYSWLFGNKEVGKKTLAYMAIMIAAGVAVLIIFG